MEVKIVFAATYSNLSFFSCSFTNASNTTQLETSFTDAKFKVLNSRKPFVCELPPLQALQTSYKRLVDLCTPSTLSGFWVSEVDIL